MHQNDAIQSNMANVSSLKGEPNQCQRKSVWFACICNIILLVTSLTARGDGWNVDQIENLEFRLSSLFSTTVWHNTYMTDQKSNLTPSQQRGELISVLHACNLNLLATPKSSCPYVSIGVRFNW